MMILPREVQKEKDLLYKNLMNIITNCSTENNYWHRLLWALEIVSKEVIRFGHTVTVEELPDFEEEEEEEKGCEIE